MASSGFLAELFADLNACRYLFLRHTTEPEENSLRLLIEEGILSRGAISVEVCGTVLGDGHRVVSDESTGLFEICWDSYVAYSVRNESYVMADDSEKFELGNFVRIYTKSWFIEYVQKATFASHEYPGPTQHIEITCENHIVDVISTVDPAVRTLRPRSSA